MHASGSGKMLLRKIFWNVTPCDTFCMVASRIIVINGINKFQFFLPDIASAAGKDKLT